METEPNTTTTNINVAVIFGVTGMVGKELAKKLLALKPKWKVYGVSRRPDPAPIQDPNYIFISCDLLDPLETNHQLCSLHAVSHIFWITWASQYHSNAPKCCEQNKAMMSNALNALLPKSKPFLKHVSLQTGMQHYVSHKQDHVHDEECPRPTSKTSSSFYHVLEDLLKEKLLEDGNKVPWSVHRPGLLLGRSRRTVYNFMGSLCVYGAICKHLKLPFVFGGTRACWEEMHLDASDARLVAEQHIWAATKTNVGDLDSSEGQAYNALNGTSFRWKEIWQAIGVKLGVKQLPGETQYLFSEDFWYAKAMSDKKHVWEEIVAKEGLKETSMEDLACWEFLDALFRPPKKLLGSRNKVDRLGFTLRYQTLDSILYWIDVMRDEKLIP